MSEKGPPLIVGFVADLMFTVRIESVAARLGYRVRWIADPMQLGPPEPDAPAHRPGEFLHGPDGRLMERLTRWQPALLLFDLTNDAIPWGRWIAGLKSSPATRRLPVLCFGSHVDVAASRAARDAGADAVVARSRFVAALPDLIAQHARAHDDEAMRRACEAPLDPRALAGIRLANAGEYYEAHEELEHAWMDDAGPGRDLYRAILQIAVAYLQIQRHNYNGAVKMLLRVRQWLAPLPDRCRGVDVARLRQDVDAVHEALLALGRDGLDDFDWSLARPVLVEEDAT